MTPVNVDVRITAYPVAINGDGVDTDIDWKGLVRPCPDLDDPAAKSFEVRCLTNGNSSWAFVKFSTYADAKRAADFMSGMLFSSYVQGYKDAQKEMRVAIGVEQP